MKPEPEGQLPDKDKETEIDRIRAGGHAVYRINDKEVEEMLDTWDITKCLHCGKEISMLNSKPVRDGFICKGGCC